MRAATAQRPSKHPRDEWEQRLSCPACRDPAGDVRITRGRLSCRACEAVFDAPLIGGQRILALTGTQRPQIGAQPTVEETKILEELTAQWNSANSANDVLREEVHRLAPGHKANFTLCCGAKQAQLAFDLDRDFASEQSALLDPSVEMLGQIATLVRGDLLQPMTIKLRSQRIPLNAHKLVMIAGGISYLPLTAGSIDTLVTPNLTDHAQRLDLIAAQAARVLETDGLWIHPGALGFTRAPTPGPEQVREILGAAGFECVRMRFRKHVGGGSLYRLASFAARRLPTAKPTLTLTS